MAVYTIHKPPVRATDPLPDAERFAFVRDGFAFRAFLLAPLWMLWHRMWLVLAGYVVVVGAPETALVALGASPTAMSVVGLFISLLIGLEASTLRRFTLWRRGWTNVGIVCGDDLEDAERRFFDAWLQEMPSRRAAPAPAGGPPVTVPRMRQTPDVIGLFPEPGARR